MSNLEKYTQVTDEDVESITNRREINRRSGDGITVVAYWLIRENVCIIFLHDARTNSWCEFPVDNAEVMEEFNHPFANRQAEMEPYSQNRNAE